MAIPLRDSEIMANRGNCDIAFSRFSLGETVRKIPRQWKTKSMMTLAAKQLRTGAMGETLQAEIRVFSTSGQDREDLGKNKITE
mmetsp:Transcript_18692/g.23205  ORF Transcript_18692/g.23205 Transcript_18692/m.23205 type:complete len:84 (-) Transcript_18692:535-786(-)